jgi:hypothetical protein
VVARHKRSGRRAARSFGGSVLVACRKRLSKSALVGDETSFDH